LACRRCFCPHLSFDFLAPSRVMVTKAANGYLPPNGTPARHALSTEAVTKLLKADVANLVKKVASGRMLTSPERRLLDDMKRGEPAPLPSEERIAAILRLRKRTEFLI